MTALTEYIYEGYSFRLEEVKRQWTVQSVINATESGDELSLWLETVSENGGKGPLLTAIFLPVSLSGSPTARAIRIIVNAPDMLSDTPGSVRVAASFAANDAESEKESFFGFGERFLPGHDQRGNTLYTWCEDGGWGLGTELRLPKGPESTYIPMPWMLARRAGGVTYGLWVNSSYRTDWDLHAAGGSGYEVSVESTWLEMVVFAGHDAASTLQLFTEATGRQRVPPPFQFGPWNQFHNEVPGISDLLDAALWFHAHDIPSSVSIDPVHFFPDGSQRGRSKELKARNQQFADLAYATLSYFNSMIDENYQPAFNQCADNGYLLQWGAGSGAHKAGSLYLFPYKGAGPDPFPVGLLDVTHPGAIQWFQSYMQDSVDVGYRGWMLDYGEYVNAYTQAHNGLRGDALHNLYPVLYQTTARDFYLKLDPPTSDQYAPNYMYYVRSGYTGMASTQWSQWTGDPSSDWTEHSGLPSQLTAMLNLGLSGISHTGSDIGGFVWLEPPSEELWMRWSALGLVSGTMHVQTGGTSILGIHKSHIHDTEEGTAIWRQFAKLRTALFPYFYTAAHEAYSTGMPLMRHHLLTHAWDSEAIASQYQFLLGGDFLVAPVVHQGETARSVYIPTPDASGNAGRGEMWYNCGNTWRFENDTGRYRMGWSSPISGPQTVTVKAPLDVVPMFVRAGAIIPTLDPSVASLLTQSSPPSPPDPRRATRPATGLPSRTTYDDRANITHLWVFARPMENDVASSAEVLAEGSAWDGRSFRLDAQPLMQIMVFPAPYPNGSTLSLTVRDPHAATRTHIVQLRLPSTSLCLQRVTGGWGDKNSTSAWPRVSSWSKLAWAESHAASSPATAWAPAPVDQPGIAWLRLGPAQGAENVAHENRGAGAAIPTAKVDMVIAACNRSLRRQNE